jgi:hypothetical protein
MRGDFRNLNDGRPTCTTISVVRCHRASSVSGTSAPACSDKPRSLRNRSARLATCVIADREHRCRPSRPSHAAPGPFGRPVPSPPASRRCRQHTSRATDVAGPFLAAHRRSRSSSAGFSRSIGTTMLISLPATRPRAAASRCPAAVPVPGRSAPSRPSSGATGAVKIASSMHVFPIAGEFLLADHPRRDRPLAAAGATQHHPTRPSCDARTESPSGSPGRSTRPSACTSPKSGFTASKPRAVPGTARPSARCSQICSASVIR